MQDKKPAPNPDDIENGTPGACRKDRGEASADQTPDRQPGETEPRRAEPVVRLLIEHKPEVMAALTPSTAQRAREATQLAVADAESVEGSTRATNPRWWRNLYAERSAHHERGGRRPRAEAEHLAYGECIARWHQLLNALNARPAPEFSESITRARPI
jgi:hypothetical protein